MKLHTLHEQSQNISKVSKYLTDVDQIHEFIKNYFFLILTTGNGSGAFITQKDYIINADFSVSFITKDTIEIRLKNSQMLIKIHKASILYFEHCKFDDMDFLPKSCTELTFQVVTFPRNCVIKTNVKKRLSFAYIGDNRIESLTISGSTPLKTLVFYYGGFDTVKNISVLTPNIGECVFYQCKDFDFTKIDMTSHIAKCQIDYCGIGNKNFNGVENFKNLDFLSFEYTSFDSYSGIENLRSAGVKFRNNTSHDKIINLLLAKVSSIDISGNINKIVYGIISKYLATANRSDHIMDCAVELIDAGFEEAAEL